MTAERDQLTTRPLKEEDRVTQSAVSYVFICFGQPLRLLFVGEDLRWGVSSGRLSFVKATTRFFPADWKLTIAIG